MKNQKFKNIGETLYDLRYFFFVLVLVTGITSIAILILNPTPITVFIGMVTITIAAWYLKQVYQKLETPNNYGVATFDGVLLERAIGPGSFPLLPLPGFTWIEHKHLRYKNKEGKIVTEKRLLTSEEMSVDISSKEVQFASGKGDSIVATKIAMAYIFDAKDLARNLYRFIVTAPGDYHVTLKDNFDGDFGTAFLNNIETQEEAQGFKDFVFRSDYSDINSKTKGVFHIDDDADDNDSTNNYGAEVPEFRTTVSKSRDFGLKPVNITVSDYQDNAKTDAARQATIQAEFSQKAKHVDRNNNELKAHKEVFDAIVIGYVGTKSKNQIIQEAIRNLAENNVTEPTDAQIYAEAIAIAKSEATGLTPEILNDLRKEAKLEINVQEQRTKDFNIRDESGKNRTFTNLNRDR